MEKTHYTEEFGASRFCDSTLAVNEVSADPLADNPSDLQAPSPLRRKFFGGIGHGESKVAGAAKESEQAKLLSFTPQ